MPSSRPAPWVGLDLVATGLQGANAMLEQERLGRHMEFDCEVLVRLHWRGVPIINLPTAVHYPRDGVSHFRLWRDNVLIAGMHTRLLLGMLKRLPVLLKRRWAR